MGDRALSFRLCVLVLVASCVASAGAEFEPKCLSRFDYDEKMLMKLIRLTEAVEKAETRLLQVEEQMVNAQLQVEEQMTNAQLQVEEQTIALGQMDAKISQVELELQNQTVEIPQTHGSTYIRWGRNSCQKNGSELVYKGYTGGSSYNSGSAADYICLTDEPLWGVYDDGAQSGRVGRVYGTAYRHRNTVPCAVCRTTRSTSIMIPGTNQCSTGWAMEYFGFLVSGRHGQSSPSNYVCMDVDPEGDAGSYYGLENVMYITVAKCGPLKCPPYVNDQELTCVVCSK